REAELVDELNTERAGIRTLQVMSARLVNQDHIGALYEHILDAAMAIMHADFASMQMLPDGGTPEDCDLHLLAWRNFHPLSVEFWRRVNSRSKTSCGEALRDRARTMVPDIETALPEGNEDLREFRRSGIRSVQSTPLFSRAGHLVGMVSTHWREPHTPKAAELRLLDILARQAADLIERVKAEQALRDAAQAKD